MRFGSIFAMAVAGLSALVSAVAVAEGATTDLANAICGPVAGTVVKSGAAFTIEWVPSAGKLVTLVLRKGTDEKLLDTLEVIAKDLPNNGVFIWVASTKLAGGDDYSIQITSSDPETSNYSAKFKIDSDGPGITGTTVVPSTTRSATATATGNIPTYTGATIANGSNPTGADVPSTTADAGEATVSSFEGAAGALAVNGWVSAMVAAAAGAVAGGLLVL